MLKTTLLLLTCLLWLPIAMSADFDDSGGSLKLAPTTNTKAPAKKAEQTGFTDNGSLQYVPPPKSKVAKQEAATVDPATTVILYGVSGCPYAKKAKDMLDAKGVPYVYIDLNSTDFHTHHEQRVIEEFKNQGASSFTNPVLEYHGVAYDNPNLYSVIEQAK